MRPEKLQGWRYASEPGRNHHATDANGRAYRCCCMPCFRRPPRARSLQKQIFSAAKQRRAAR